MSRWTDFCCFCRATFDRIAEININIDAGQDVVSSFTYILWHCIIFFIIFLAIMSQNNNQSNPINSPPHSGLFRWAIRQAHRAAFLWTLVITTIEQCSAYVRYC